MVPILSLLLIVGTSLIITRAAAVMLEHTGLSRDAARFQARSAFTGVGFTTGESESVVEHPVRRKVVAWLMLVGNVGIVSAVAAVLLSAIDLRSEQGIGVLLAVLFGGLALLWGVSASRAVDAAIARAVRWAMMRWTQLDTHDYAQLLHLRDEYGVSRLRVETGDWLAGKSLRAARLADEGLLVLGVECPGGSFLGTPAADVEVRAGDEVVIYGPADRVSELCARAPGTDGDAAHAASVAGRQDRVRLERSQSER